MATTLQNKIQAQEVENQKLPISATTPVQSSSALQNVNLMQSLISQPTMPAGTPIVATCVAVGVVGVAIAVGAEAVAAVAVGAVVCKPVVVNVYVFGLNF